MERSNSFLFQSCSNNFNDFTNCFNYTDPTAPVKHLQIKNYLNAQLSPSKKINPLNGPPNRELNDVHTEQKFLQSYFSFLTPRMHKRQGSNHVAFSNQSFEQNPFDHSRYEQNIFNTVKPPQNSFSRPFKIQNFNLNNSDFRITTQKQNKQIAFQKNFQQRSEEKEKFCIRQSLGSLSKQIKNTFKLTTVNNTLLSEHLKIKQRKNSKDLQNQSSLKLPFYHKKTKSKLGQQLGVNVQQYVKHKKSPSFLLNGQKNEEAGKINNLKLEFSEKNTKNQYNSSNKENIKYSPAEGFSFRQNCLKKQIQSRQENTTQRVFYSDQNQMKYSSVTGSSNLNIRKDKKNVTANHYREFINKPNDKTQFESSFKPEKFPDFLEPSTFPSSIIKNCSPLQYSCASVFESSKIRKQKQNFSQKQQGNLGQQITLNDFHLGSVKGQGRFGKFYPAIHKKSGFLVGIKEVKKELLINMLDQFIQQLKIQSYIQHSNIVKLYGYFRSKQNFYLILEYMEEGSLFSFIKKLKKLPEEESSNKIKQICSAVQFLHENQILHRDIKPENIVMTCNVCKLCDFGWAAYSNTRRKTYCGTLDYVCPEILEGDSYDHCVDIWAIGVLAYEMIVGKAPFYNVSRKQTMKKIMECNFQFPKTLSSSAKQFISKALNKNPDNRSSISNLIKHQFLN